MKQHVVIYLENGKREEALLPLDIPLHRLVPALARKLRLPERDTAGHPLQYHLELYRNGRRLLDEQTLRQSRVTPKTRLKLISAHKPEPAESIRVAPPLIHPATVYQKVTLDEEELSSDQELIEALEAELRHRIADRLPTIGTILGVLVLIWLMARAYSHNQIRTAQSYNTPIPSTYEFTHPAQENPQASNLPNTVPTEPVSIPNDEVDPALFDASLPYPLRSYLEAGMIREYYFAILGPDAPTSCGDPFSNPTSPYRSDEYVNEVYPGHYSYRYRVEIPENYSYDAVRVELFDPDSINQAVASDLTLVQHTQLYASYTRKADSSKYCRVNGEPRRQPCVMNTGEPPTLNPYWFVRVDGIRFNRSDSCSPDSTYDPEANTQTAFDLYYWHQNPFGQLERIPIATYIGQTGLEAESHDTDLRWVSPGGALASDQSIFVSVTEGPGTFEVPLSILSELPIDPLTGEKYLYLDVTALRGRNENGYGIWAGPPLQAVDNADSEECLRTRPSNVNVRNRYIVDCQDYHRAGGIVVQPMGVMVLHSNTDWFVDIFLRFVEPDYAGSKIFVSLFDAGAGAEAPVVFYFDRLAVNWSRPRPIPPANPVNFILTDWAMVFGVNHTVTDDPDLDSGLERSCVPGLCEDQWISPAYRLSLPNFTPDCTTNYRPFLCQPFYGGWLIARYDAGIHNTYAWLVVGPELPIQE